VHVRLDADSDFARYRGQLEGAIVLDGAIALPDDRFMPPGRREGDAELGSLTRVTASGSGYNVVAEIPGADPKLLSEVVISAATSIRGPPVPAPPTTRRAAQ
jgi:hypothetical protein